MGSSSWEIDDSAVPSSEFNPSTFCFSSSMYLVASTIIEALFTCQINQKIKSKTNEKLLIYAKEALKAKVNMHHIYYNQCVE